MTLPTLRSRAFHTARALRRMQMPRREVRAVLRTEDPLVVHRYFELHGERLQEWVADQRRSMAVVERTLAGSAEPLAQVDH